MQCLSYNLYCCISLHNQCM